MVGWLDDKQKQSGARVAVQQAAPIDTSEVRVAPCRAIRTRSGPNTTSRVR